MTQFDQIVDLLQQGIQAARAGREQEARELLMRVIELDERNEQAWLWLSGVVESVEERRICLENVLTLNPDNAHAQQGLRWLAQHHPVTEDDAERCPRCQSVVPSAGDTCPHCDQLLVVICPGCGEYIEVEYVVCPECGQFLGDFRDGAHHYLALAEAYLERQRFTLAQGMIDRAEREAPHDAQVLETAGRLQEEIGHTDLAIEIYRRAIERHPQNPLYYARMGAIYRRRVMPDQALEMYQQAVALDDEDPQTLFVLAELYVEEGLVSRAGELLERAVEIEPQFAKALLLLSDLYMKQGKSKRAIQLYEQASLLSDPHSPVGRRARRKLMRLRPSVSERHAQGWGETVRRTTGLMLTPILAAWVNATLIPPLHVSLAAVFALLVALIGSFLWACGMDVPRNAVMRELFGPSGAREWWQKALVGLPGGAAWALGVGLILAKA